MDYSASITVSATPVTASHAIRKEMHIWWSTRVEMSAKGATIRFNNSHVTFDFAPESTDTTFEWLCTDANMIIEGVEDTEEWTGTSLLWSLQPIAGGTKISFTHKGLNQNLECLDVCTRGWEHFFEESLRMHLNGEKPTPETST